MIIIVIVITLVALTVREISLDFKTKRRIDEIDKKLREHKHNADSVEFRKSGDWIGNDFFYGCNIAEANLYELLSAILDHLNIAINTQKHSRKVNFITNLPKRKKTTKAGDD